MGTVSFAPPGTAAVPAGGGAGEEGCVCVWGGWWWWWCRRSPVEARGGPGSGAVSPARGAQVGRGAPWPEGPAGAGRCPPVRGRVGRRAPRLFFRLPREGLAVVKCVQPPVWRVDLLSRCIPGGTCGWRVLWALSSGSFLNFNHAWIYGMVCGLNYLRRWQFPLRIFMLAVCLPPLVSALLVLASSVR